MDKKIIDVCCGGKMFWFDKQNPAVVYCDKRQVPEMICCDGKKFSVQPDVVCDFTALPFADNTFYLAVFDPPHLINAGEKSYMAVKYGKLDEDWQSMIRSGFDECMRVLKPNGILVFKWNDIQIPTRSVINAIGHEPLFGHPSGKKSKTHWLCFMKL